MTRHKRFKPVETSRSRFIRSMTRYGPIADARLLLRLEAMRRRKASPRK